MNVIDSISLSQCNSSQYLRPLRMRFNHNGKARTWDLTRGYDSVAVLLYHETKESFVFVRQFRPAVFVNSIEGSLEDIDFNNHSTELGMTLELCAGIVDKDADMIDIAKEEILEECGFDLPIELIEKVTSYRSSVGIGGSKQTLYFAKINDTFKKSEGGGIDDESIEVVYIPISKAVDLIFDEQLPRPPGFMFALMWFYQKYKPTLLKL